MIGSREAIDGRSTARIRYASSFTVHIACSSHSVSWGAARKLEEKKQRSGGVVSNGILSLSRAHSSLIFSLAVFRTTPQLTERLEQATVCTDREVALAPITVWNSTEITNKKPLIIFLHVWLYTLQLFARAFTSCLSLSGTNFLRFWSSGYEEKNL